MRRHPPCRAGRKRRRIGMPLGRRRAGRRRNDRHRRRRLGGQLGDLDRLTRRRRQWGCDDRRRWAHRDRCRRQRHDRGRRRDERLWPCRGGLPGHHRRRRCDPGDAAGHGQRGKGHGQRQGQGRPARQSHGAVYSRAPGSDNQPRRVTPGAFWSAADSRGKPATSGTKRTGPSSSVIEAPSLRRMRTSRWSRRSSPTGTTRMPPSARLLDQLPGSSRRRGGDDDAVERRLLRPALGAVAEAADDIVDAELGEALLGLLAAGRDSARCVKTRRHSRASTAAW